MKRISGKHSLLRCLWFFQYLFFAGKIVRTILLFIVAIIFSGCFQHYLKTNTQDNVDSSSVQRLVSINKYLIVHFKNKIAGLKNAAVLNDMLEADFVTLPPVHSNYLNPRVGTNRIKHWDNQLLIEVHLYSPTEISAQQNHLSIPLSSFNRIDIYERDKRSTTENHVISWVGVAAAIAFTVLITLIVISCVNCY
jgi:hypothetical protein